MRDLRSLARTLRLGPVVAVRLTGWKAWQAAVRTRDRQTRSGEYVRAGARFGATWDLNWSARGLRSWLERPGAGRFFVEPKDAADWCRSTHTDGDQELADATAAGVFDLLASGPRDLGVPPRWRTDLYTGFEWPLEDAHRIPIVRGDGSDIRTVWELSRAYHVVALARAYHQSRDGRFARAFMEHVDSWIEQNPVGFGPHWASPMDAAIRGANWAIGLLLFADSPEVDPAFVARMLSNLYATALHVERHREWHPVFRGNHYVANGVGLACLGALFRGDRRGERWLQRGARIIADELLRQVQPDGVSFEASIGYHRLATQLFGWGAELVRRNTPGLWTDAHEERLASMFDFIDAYTPPSGLAPLIGDNDDGHLLVMDARMLREPRRHRLGLPPRPGSPKAVESGLYRGGGFAVLRHDEDHCIVRCGPVGLYGAGSHDHNDQLSFELVIGGERIVRDSGTWCYTRDLARRLEFRSTAAHSSVQLGGEEQNPIRASAPWRVLEDRTRARVLDFHAGPDVLRFAGEHRGYAHLEGSPRVRRVIDYSPLPGTWSVTDEVLGVAEHHFVWRLHLEGAAEVIARAASRVEIRLGGVRIVIDHPHALSFELLSCLYSERYGAVREAPVLQLEGSLSLPIRVHTRYT